MRITLHDYVTDPLLTQKDGVNLAHENIASLLKSCAIDNVEVSFHDFNRLLRDDSYAEAVLTTTDCVVSNVGPHAHYYFYLRDKLQLDFRITRDVRTAIWSSYLLQEYLCAPFLRDSDVLFVASHYTRGVYERIFPHLRCFSTVRCYPLTVGFPGGLPPRHAAGNGHDAPFVLGYIGRLSEDKNFPDLVRLLIALNQTRGRRYKLLACGDIHSRSCHPSDVQQQITAALGDGDYFEHLPPRRNGQIWELYRRFDAMIFPSTSNLETLGRVLVEASYAGVPVVCGDHAAASELVPAASLCPVAYATGQRFDTHDDHSLGRVDIGDMMSALTNPALCTPSCHLDYLEHPSKFIDILRALAADEPFQDSEAFTLTPAQQDFIRSVDIELPPLLHTAGARAMIERFLPWFMTLQQRGTPEQAQALADLDAISRFPQRTARFADKCASTNSDFTNVGGIDIELCHVAGFYPRFRLTPALGDVRATSTRAIRAARTADHAPAPRRAAVQPCL